MHAISPPRGKNPAKKAAYLLPKKAVYVSRQKRQPTSPAKKWQPIPRRRRSRKKKQRKKKEEAEEEQHKWIIKNVIVNSVHPHELLPGVSHLANPGICNTTTTTTTTGWWSVKGFGAENRLVAIHLNNPIGPIARNCPKWPLGNRICLLELPDKHVCLKIRATHFLCTKLKRHPMHARGSILP